MKPKILITDDEPLTRNLMAQALQAQYECLTASDAEAAMAQVAANPDLKLILTDYKMPGLSGIELIRRAKAAIPALARVLQRPGIGGHAQKMQADVPVIPGYANTAGDWERTLSLREICIARALYRLGDTPDGLGRRTLEAYADDPRRAFAQHAKLVLGH